MRIAIMFKVETESDIKDFEFARKEAEEIFIDDCVSVRDNENYAYVVIDTDCTDLYILKAYLIKYIIAIQDICSDNVMDMIQKIIESEIENNRIDFLGSYNLFPYIFPYISSYVSDDIIASNTKKDKEFSISWIIDTSINYKFMTPIGCNGSITDNINTKSVSSIYGYCNSYADAVINTLILYIASKNISDWISIMLSVLNDLINIYNNHKSKKILIFSNTDNTGKISFSMSVYIV